MKRPANNIEYCLMPGLDGTGDLFQPLVQSSPPDCPMTVIRYPSNRCLEFEEYVQNAKSQIPRDREVILIAESFSGMIAIQLLTEKPPNVMGAVFCGAFAASPRPMLLTFTELIPMTGLHSSELPSGLLRSLCVGQEASETLVEQVRKAFLSVAPPVLAHRVELLHTLDLVSEMSGIKTPCCYLRARHDRLIPVSCIDPFRQHLPALQEVSLDGPHFLLQSEPEECMDVIEEFKKYIVGRRPGASMGSSGTGERES